MRLASNGWWRPPRHAATSPWIEIVVALPSRGRPRNRVTGAGRLDTCPAPGVAAGPAGAEVDIECTTARRVPSKARQDAAVRRGAGPATAPLFALCRAVRARAVAMRRDALARPAATSAGR